VAYDASKKPKKDFSISTLSAMVRRDRLRIAELERDVEKLKDDVRHLQAQNPRQLYYPRKLY